VVEVVVAAEYRMRLSVTLDMGEESRSWSADREWCRIDLRGKLHKKNGIGISSRKQFVGDYRLRRSRKDSRPALFSLIDPYTSPPKLNLPLRPAVISSSSTDVLDIALRIMLPPSSSSARTTFGGRVSSVGRDDEDGAKFQRPRHPIRPSEREKVDSVEYLPVEC
jgi:hypothetical protein